MAIETELAKVSKTKVERRDPGGLYNKIDRAGVEKAAPLFPWAAYFKALGLDGVNDVNVTAPKFFAGMDALLASQQLGAWKSYLGFHVLHRASPLLSKAYVDEAFALERDLTGQKEQRTRWKRCVDASDSGLGELLAQAWVKERFTPEAKASVQAMVREIGQAFSASVGALPWMDEPTRAVTRDKLAAMAYLIGYPDKWKVYDFAVKRGGHADNVFAARAHELKTRLGRIGKPVDRGEWFMTPPTVNAYYDPQKNQMVFPAGILQPPFYSPTSSVAVNLGAMGMVVGHELTHGFDDEGSQFDKNGNLLAWWPEAVRGRYMKQTECIRDQYSAFEPLPGVKVNGQLTLGENIADNGGVKLAFRAYRAMRRDAPEELLASGFGEDQQFFLATGQLWCSKYREEAARMQVKVDPHSPTRFRVNGPLSNSQEFAAAFQCKAGSAMVPAKRCDVW
jgi:putative endopeptidase